MKKMCVSVLVLLLAGLSLFGCERRDGGYTLLDVPKELEIDVSALSEDADDLMSSAQTTPLLAALPQEGLYVYSTDPTVVSGVLVKYDGLLQYFPWRFAPRLAQPELYVSDYNADGKKDIAFTYVSQAGDPVFNENLHVLLRGDKGFTDNLYTGEKASIEIGNHLVVEAAEEPDTFTAYLDGKPTPFTLSGHGDYVDLYMKQVQDFTIGDEITVRIEPGIVFRDEGLPVYDVIHYTAQVEFVNDILTQTNPQISF